MSGSGDSPVEEASAGEWNRRPVRERRTWFTVARKDVADAGRSWQLYVLAGVFTTVMTFGMLEPVLEAMALGTVDPDYVVQDGLESATWFVELIVPLVGLLLGHVAITSEFERGSLRTLLALPISRRDVVLGKLVGRVAVLWVTLAVGLGVALVATWLSYEALDVVTYAGFSVSVLLFGACFVTMAVGISAASRTRGRALGWTMGVFVLITFLWEILLSLQQLVTDVSPTVHMGEPNTAPGWYVFLDRAQPGTALRHVITEWVVPVLPNTTLGETNQEPALTTNGPEPFYLDEWSMLLVLLAWGIVPLAVGYWRFRDAEVV